MQEGIKFIPIVAETLGGWDKVAVEEIKKLAIAKARHLGGEEEEQIRSSALRVPEPDPIPGISFDTRPDPIQF